LSGIRFGVKDIASICEFVIALNEIDQWLYADTPLTLNQPDWEFIPGLPSGAASKRFIGRIPLLIDDQWVSAGLFNSASSSSSAFAVYRRPSTSQIEVKSWTNRYPAGVSLDPIQGTADSMPKANVAANWGDYVLLGDIQWKKDPTLAYSSGNTAPYPHGIWFSRPGSSDVWHPDEVFFVGQKLERNAILGMFPMEQGLLVVSQSSISLLRGRPGARAEDFVYEELRSGISPSTKDEVAFWAHTGLVVWLDRRGRVWATNGDTISRLDVQVEIDKVGPGCVLAVDEYLFVSGRKDVRLLSAFGQSAAWTSLITPTGWQKAVSCRSIVVGVGAGQDSQGTFILDDAVLGLLDNNTLYGFTDTIQVFDLASQDRGTVNGKAIRPIMRTRPLPGASERTAFWHRFGVRSEGPGYLRRAVSYPGADVTVRGWETRVNGRLDKRKDWAFTGHGPSIEAVFEFEFEGDVTPEHVTIGAHRGRPER